MKKRNLFLTRLLLLITFLVIALAVWTGRAEADVHYMPDYEKIDLQDILQKEYLEVRDYEVLLRQTVFFASTFWTKLQNIFGHYCKSKLEKVAKPRLAAILPAA